MKYSGERFRLEPEVDQVEENAELMETEAETHYLFGLNGIFSFEENSSVFSVVDREEKTEVIHQFQRKGDMWREIEEMEKEKAVGFLSKMGFEPFMRLDIERSSYEDEKGRFVVEEIEQLGIFTDREELGEEEVFYIDELKNDMINDSDKKEEITEQARRIIRRIKS